MSGLLDLFGPDEPQPCPSPAAHVIPYQQGGTHAWVAVCDTCEHKVKHDRRDGATRIRDHHNRTGEWDPAT